MKVIGTDLYANGLENAVQLFLDGLNEPAQNRCISPSDANVLVEARRNKHFRKILHSFYLNLPDGVPSVWVLKRKGAKNANRCCGPDFFEAVMKQSTGKANHFFLGGAVGVAEELKKTCESWGNENVVGVYSPPFKHHSEMNYAEMAQHIKQSGANVVWIGLGAPKQIYVAHELAKHVEVKYIVTVGAAFDFHTGRVKKAPKWIQKIGMEWFFRMCVEPKRLLKRYFKVVPLFLLYAFRDGFKSN